MKQNSMPMTQFSQTINVQKQAEPQPLSPAKHVQAEVLKSPQRSPKNADQKKADDKAPATTELAKIQATSATFIQPEMLAAKCPQQPQTELVVQFVDFSSKYGLGYKLSNGSYGVLFNDSTKIITHPDLFHFDYIDRVRGGLPDQQDKVQ